MLLLIRPLISLSRGYTKMTGMDLGVVTTALKKFAAPSLAGSWDNVGLLIEPSPPHKVQKMILTNDLTENVMEEAISARVNMILSYHPPIFAPLKRLCQGKWKERLVISCIENRIALYSPHTSYDALEGGVNDWLITPFGGKVKPLEVVHQPSLNTTGKYRLDISIDAAETDICTERINEMENVDITSSYWTENLGKKALHVTTNANDTGLTKLVEYLNQNEAVRKTMEITELQKIPIPNHGAGRLSVLDKGINLSTAVGMVKSHLNLQNLRLAKAVGKYSDPLVKSIAVCAGSGSSVLSGVDADLYITGEMSHHEVLDAVQNGHSVILCDHSNTERGYLPVLKEKLSQILGDEVEIIVSSKDADPLQIV